MTVVEAAAILGIPTNATKDEALSAYRTQAKLVHPDRFSDASEKDRKAASDTMARINHAVEVFLASTNNSTENFDVNNDSSTNASYKRQSPPSSNPPGWYPDPDNPQTIRYWNGNNWEHLEESVYFSEKGDWHKGRNYWEESYARPPQTGYPNVSKTSKLPNSGMVGPIEALVSFFVNSFKIRYSSTRAEFWWIAVWIFLLDIFFYLFETVILKTSLPSFTSLVEYYTAESEVNAGYTIVSLALLIPSLTLTVRRLHDVKATGWWLPILTLGPLISFIFLDTLYAVWVAAIGWVVLFVLLVSGSRSSKWPSLLRGADSYGRTTSRESNGKPENGKKRDRFGWTWIAAPVVFIIAQVVRALTENS